MTRSVHVSGPFDGLREAIEERLVRAGIILAKTPEQADLTLQIGDQNKCDISIVPRGSEFTKSSIVIQLFDVIIPNGGRNWGNGIMIDWVEKVTSGKRITSDSTTRFWVNVRDVADAISEICVNRNEESLMGNFVMCGRRAWGVDDVTDEIRVLWERYSNAINYSHTTESLSEVPSPVRGMHSESIEKPDLSDLHELLIQSGSEGWHPLVPMRVSLMEMIASVENSS